MDSEFLILRLIEVHEKPLCRYAFSLCGCEATARDAVQETFLRLCKVSLKQIEGHEAAWLFRVCRSRVLDLRKKEKPMQVLSSKHAATLSGPEPSPDEQAARKDAESWVPRLMATLTERQQEILRLKFQQNLSYREIAEVLKISESNVGYILHKALTSLKNDMKDLQGVSS